METIRQTDPTVGSMEWWGYVDAEVDAYVGYPNVQESVLEEAYKALEMASMEELYRQHSATEVVGALSMAGAMA